MASLFFDGNLRRIYEVPDNSSFVVDGDGYRIYTPNVIPPPETTTIITHTELWSRWVDYHNQNKWALAAYTKSGGALRGQDELGNNIFATFDIRLQNEWAVVPANYAHKFVILGNMFGNESSGLEFDVSHITEQGVLVKVQLSDSLQIVRQSGNGVGVSAQQVWEHILNSGLTAEQAIEQAVIAAQNTQS